MKLITMDLIDDNAKHNICHIPDREAWIHPAAMEVT